MKDKRMDEAKIEEAIDLALHLAPSRNSEDFDLDKLPPVLQLMVLHCQVEAKVAAALDRLFSSGENE